MGMDIHGYIEVKLEYGPRSGGSQWKAAIDIDLLGAYNRYRVIWQALFGVCPEVDLPVGPVAYERGIPQDASDLVRKKYGTSDDSWCGSSWISAKELLDVEWPTFEPSPDPDEEDYLVGISDAARPMIEHASGGWRPVLGAVSALVAVHGPDRVRIVVWFDI